VCKDYRTLIGQHNKPSHKSALQLATIIALAYSQLSNVCKNDRVRICSHMVDSPMISAVTTHETQHSDLSSSTCELPSLRVSHQEVPQRYLCSGPTNGLSAAYADPVFLPTSENCEYRLFRVFTVLGPHISGTSHPRAYSKPPSLMRQWGRSKIATISSAERLFQLLAGYL